MISDHQHAFNPAAASAMGKISRSVNAASTVAKLRHPVTIGQNVIVCCMEMRLHLRTLAARIEEALRADAVQEDSGCSSGYLRIGCQ